MSYPWTCRSLPYVDLVQKRSGDVSLRAEVLLPPKPQNELDLSSFRGKVDLDSVLLAGHSFGGATVLKALHTDHQFKGSRNGQFGTTIFYRVPIPWWFEIRFCLLHSGSPASLPICYSISAQFSRAKA